MRIIKFYLLTVIYLFIMTNCQNNSNKNTKMSYPLKVLVSLGPQKFFVEKIGGDKIAVEILGKNVISHDHTVSIKELQKFSNASMYIKLGVGGPHGFHFETKSERQLISLTKKNIKIISMGKGIKLNNEDPHIWLSPKIMIECSKNIYNAIKDLDPKNNNYYKTNYKNLIKEIKSISNKIKNNLKNVKGKSFLSYHPAWQYFAKDYEINEIAIVEHHQALSLKKMNELIIHAKKNKIKTITIPHEVFRKEVENIAKEINGEIIITNPLPNLWKENIIKVSEKLGQSMAKNDK